MVLPPAEENTHLYLLNRSISQLIFRHDLPYHSSKQLSFPTKKFFVWSFSSASLVVVTVWTTQFWTEPLGDQTLPLFACSPNTLDLVMALDLQGRFLSAEFSTKGTWLCFFPTVFMSSTYTEKNNPNFLCTWRHSHVGTFSNPSSNSTSSNFSSQRRRPNGWPYKFLQRCTMGSSIVPQLFSLCRGRMLINFRTFCFRHSWQSGSFGHLYLTVTLKSRHMFLQSIQEVSRKCPRTLLLPSVTLKHLFCECCIVSFFVFDVVSPEHNSLPVLQCFASSAFFKWQTSIKFARWTVVSSFFAWRMTSDFDLAFFTSHAGTFLCIFPLYSHGGFGFWNLKACWIETGCVPGHRESFPHTVFRRCGPYVVAPLFRILRIWSFLTVVKVSLNCHHSPCAALQEHCLLRASDERQQSPSSNLRHPSMFRRFLSCGVLLGCLHFLLPILQFIFPFCFFENLFQASSRILSGLEVSWNCAGLPFTHLVSFRKSST